MNEEEGRTPIYFVMGLGDQFSHRVSTNSDDGKRAIVGYLLTNSITKKAEPIMPLPDTTFFVIQLRLEQREAIFERLRKALQAPTEAEGGLTARQEITLGKAEDAYIQDRLEDADRMLTHLGY